MTLNCSNSHMSFNLLQNGYQKALFWVLVWFCFGFVLSKQNTLKISGRKQVLRAFYKNFSPKHLPQDFIQNWPYKSGPTESRGIWLVGFFNRKSYNYNL